MMTEQEYLRKKTIKDIVDHPDFNDMIEEMRLELAHRMLYKETEAERTKIHYEVKGLDAFVGKLTEIANEVKAYNG